MLVDLEVSGHVINLLFHAVVFSLQKIYLSPLSLNYKILSNIVAVALVEHVRSYFLFTAFFFIGFIVRSS